MSAITVRETVLSDGRQLIYFDDADTTLTAERRPDARMLESRPVTATMRQDVLTGEWVSIAAARQNRIFLPSEDADPLAPASALNLSEIPDNYDVAVFENRCSMLCLCGSVEEPIAIHAVVTSLEKGVPENVLGIRVSVMPNERNFDIVLVRKSTWHDRPAVRALQT